MAKNESKINSNVVENTTSSSLSDEEWDDDESDEDAEETEEEKELSEEDKKKIVNQTEEKIKKEKEKKTEVKVTKEEEKISPKDSDKKYKNKIIKRELINGKRDGKGNIDTKIRNTYEIENNVTKQLFGSSKYSEGLKNAFKQKNELFWKYIEESFDDLKKKNAVEDIEILNEALEDPIKNGEFMGNMRFLLMTGSLPEKWHPDNNWELGYFQKDFTDYVKYKIWNVDVNDIEILEINDVSNKGMTTRDGNPVLTTAKVKIEDKTFMCYLTVIKKGEFLLLDFKEVK